MGFDELYNDFPELFESYRRRRSLFWWVERSLSEFDRILERMFRETGKAIPKQQMIERRFSDSSVTREWGQFVYGYSMSVGSDGKQAIREFENVKGSKKQREPSFEQPILEHKWIREPLIDIIQEPEHVRIVTELPGVKKSEVKTVISDNTLTVKVNSPAHKYLREVQLPVRVDPDTSNVSYKNGVLEVNVKKLTPRNQKAGKAKNGEPYKE